MKAVILAGGYGTRISEESRLRPKPMVEIGNRPILWHIMKIYSEHGINDFVICCGYKGHMIKQYFADYYLRNADVTFDFTDLEGTKMTVHTNNTEPWRVTLVDTGEGTMTGGRLKRVADYVKDGTFCLTYGDGVGNVDIAAAIKFHKTQGKLATLTAVHPPGRFGAFTLANGSNQITQFTEKPTDGDDLPWINGGFFVLEPEIFEYIDGDQTSWEKEPLERLAKNGQLSAFRHEGFWQPMDTLRDKMFLEKLWNDCDQPAPWKIWGEKE